MKTRIYSPNKGPDKTKVIIEYYDEFIDEARVMRVFVPICGGYVRELDPPNRYITEAFSPDKELLRFGQVIGDNFLKFIRRHWVLRGKNLTKSSF
jgi:hypothetical protein